jgi:DnaK suppressor protein
MDVDRLAYFRKRLEELEREIREDMDANPEDSGVVELDSSIGRLSRMDALQNQQMALELKRRQENQLLRIENAFKRLAKGHYSLCGKCKKPIEEDRLEVFPDTVTCVRCA